MTLCVWFSCMFIMRLVYGDKRSRTHNKQFQQRPKETNRTLWWCPQPIPHIHDIWIQNLPQESDLRSSFFSPENPLFFLLEKNHDDELLDESVSHDLISPTHQVRVWYTSTGTWVSCNWRNNMWQICCGRSCPRGLVCRVHYEVINRELNRRLMKQ